MQSYVAEIGEIVRAQRRDEEELQQLQERLSKVIKELAGQQTWLRVFPYLPVVAKAAYYSCTLLSGAQTLGEEYVRLFESAGLRRISPSLTSRLLFVLLHVFAPLVSQYAIQKAHRRLNHPSTTSFLGLPIRNNKKARQNLLGLVEWIRATGIPQLRRLHLAVFYIYGAYYNISRRATGIRFLSLSPQSNIAALKVYRVLGYLTLAQTGVSISVWLLSLLEEEKKRVEQLKNARGQPPAKEDTVAASDDYAFAHEWFRCPVCLESRHPSTAACGHLFCWNCIQEHALTSESEPKCPQCRSPFEPRHIVPLLNL